MGRVTGRSCIVTGAAQGIGRAIADALLDEGADVCLADINGDKVAQVADANGDRAMQHGGKVTHAQVDVTDRASVKAMIAHAVQVNGLGCMIGMQEAAHQMIAQGTGGKIINTASIASRQGFDNVAPYCASKFAVVALTQSGARDLAKHNITVTGFAPGVVATEMWEQVDQDLMEIGAADRPGQAMEEFSSEILRGRVANTEDITGTTTYLASKDSDYMTGQIVMIDGGMTLV